MCSLICVEQHGMEDHCTVNREGYMHKESVYSEKEGLKSGDNSAQNTLAGNHGMLHRLIQ